MSAIASRLPDFDFCCFDLSLEQAKEYLTDIDPFLFALNPRQDFLLNGNFFWKGKLYSELPMRATGLANCGAGFQPALAQ